MRLAETSFFSGVPLKLKKRIILDEHNKGRPAVYLQSWSLSCFYLVTSPAKWSKRDNKPQPPDFKAGALITRQHWHSITGKKADERKKALLSLHGMRMLNRIIGINTSTFAPKITLLS